MSHILLQKHFRQILKQLYLKLIDNHPKKLQCVLPEKSNKKLLRIIAIKWFILLYYVTNWKDVFSISIGQGERHFILGIIINDSPTCILDTGSNLEDI